MRIESFRRKSLEDVLDSTQKAMRKDSVVPLSMCRDASGLSVPGTGRYMQMYADKLTPVAESMFHFSKID